MKGIIHYKVFDLRMIYSPFPQQWGMENLPRDKLRIHLQYSKDIKRFKLCIGGVGVRTTKKGFYQMWNFHNRVRGLWVIMIPESMAAFMICSRACTHCMFSLLRLLAADLVLTQTSLVSVYTDIPNVLELEQITFLHFCLPHKFPLHCNTKQ